MKYFKKVICDDNERLMLLLKQKKISYRVLEQETGINFATLQKILTGKRICSENIFKKIKSAIHKL